MKNPTIAEYSAVDFQYEHIDITDYTLTMPPHTHTGWELLLVKSGELIYSADGNFFHIPPNHLIISRPGEVHMLHSDSAIHYDRYDLIVSQQLLNKLAITHLPDNLYAIDVSNNSMIISLFKKFDFYISHLQGHELDLLLRGLIPELWVNIRLSTQLFPNLLASQSNTVITQAIHYIKEHIEESLTVPQISEALFISPRYLYYCFAKHMNISPKQYIMLQKLQMVQQALSNNVNPTSACRQYGFGTYSTFFRNYQKIYGCRPSDNAQKNLQKIEL